MSELVELVEQRTLTSKTFHKPDGGYVWEGSIGAIHYKDNYASNEQWKDIDLNWEGNKITKAPYELTLEGNKLTIRDKKSGEVSTIELDSIGVSEPPRWSLAKGKATCKDFELDMDLEIVAENSRVKFTRVLKSSKAPVEAKFKVTGNLRVRASDTEGELPVEATLKDGILTERLKPNRPIKYPVRIDPTWQVGESSDDCRVYWTGSVWDLSLTPPLQSAGWNTTTKAKDGGGMRFLNITIPQGTTIDAAYLILTCRDALTGVVVNTRITGEDVDNAATFSTLADYQARRGTVVGGANDNYITTAQVDWDAIPVWTVNTEYNSPEIKTIIQEIINRGGWAGNALVLFWDDHDDRSTHAGNTYRSGWSYNGSTAKAPKLYIEYTPPVIEKTSSDTGSGVEALIQTVTLVKAESGSGVESLGDRAFVLPESGGGVDASLLLAALLKVDVGSGLDALIELTQLIEKLSSDAGSGLDTLTALNIALMQSDTGTGLDTALLLAALLSSDQALGVDELLALAKAIIALDYAIGTDRFIALIQIPTKGGDMKLPPTLGQTSIPSGRVSLPSN